MKDSTCPPSGAPIDPCELLRRCLTGRNAGDWQELVDRHGHDVRLAVQQAASRCGMSLAGPDLDEMVQDLYCRLLSVRDRGVRGGSAHELWKYLLCVANSLVVDRMRQQNARKRRPSGAGRRVDPSRLRSPILDPEEELIKKERRKVFFKRCLEVVRCDRVALELRALTMALLDGWSSREIAQELKGGLSADRVDKLVYLLRCSFRRDGIRMPRRYCASLPVTAPTC